MEVLIPILIYVGVIGAILYGVTKKSANAPIEKNPPREKVQRAFTIGDRVLDRVAGQFGLRHDVDMASGTVNGIQVAMSAEPSGTGPTSFSGAARFARSLGLELAVTHRGALGGRSGDPVVSEAFDHEFEVEALHHDQAAALLAGELEERFLRAVARGARIELDDRELRLTMDASLGVDRAIELLTWLVETAGEIGAARTRLPRPELEQRLLEAFNSLAGNLGGTVDDGELSLVLEEGKLRAHVEQQGKNFGTRIVLELARPLTLDLRLGLESDRSRFARWQKRDVTVGDAKFDDTFVVFGEPEDEVRSTLDRALREDLLALASDAESFAMSPTDLDVSVDHPLDEPSELGEWIERIRSVARHFVPQRSGGAYR
ncbi:MAG: hypothetical protein U0263_27165 [Polyangiaceae bacterium]